MISVTVDRKQMLALQRAIEGTNKKIEKALQQSVRSSSKKAVTIVSQSIQEELKVTAAENKKHITRKLKLQSHNPSGRITLKRSSRIPLKYFNAKQTKAGVSYKVNPRGKRSVAAGAFISNKLGGHAFQRKGKRRLPILKLFGASPWGAFKKRRKEPAVRARIQQHFNSQIARRIRDITRKKQGKF